MTESRMPARFHRVENVAIAVAVVISFVVLGFDWWWLLVLFLAFDISALGYLVNPRIGAVGYNMVHNYVGPAILLALWLLLGAWPLVFVALAWAFHIAADRALGYGLKHPDAFEHTDLGVIGKAARVRRG